MNSCVCVFFLLTKAIFGALIHKIVYSNNNGSVYSQCAFFIFFFYMFFFLLNFYLLYIEEWNISFCLILIAIFPFQIPFTVCAKYDFSIIFGIWMCVIHTNATQTLYQIVINGTNAIKKKKKKNQMKWNYSL